MLLTSPPIVRSAVLRLSTTAQKQVNAPVAWQRWGLDGTGIGVAVIDSGVTAVGDLYWWIPSNQTYGSRVVYSQNFVPGTTDSSDQYGHGTHVRSEERRVGKECRSGGGGGQVKEGIR